MKRFYKKVEDNKGYLTFFLALITYFKICRNLFFLNSLKVDFRFYNTWIFAPKIKSIRISGKELIIHFCAIISIFETLAMACKYILHILAFGVKIQMRYSTRRYWVLMMCTLKAGKVRFWFPVDLVLKELL